MSAVIERSDRGLHIRKAGVAFVFVTCAALLGHAVDARLERQELRAERAEEKLLAEKIKAVEKIPIEKFFPHYRVTPVSNPVPLDKPTLMQSDAQVDFDGRITHTDRLRCFPLEADGKLGKGRLLRPAVDSFLLATRRMYGPDKPKVVPEGYKWTDGQWYFAGPRPEHESDCIMISNPCIEPMKGVERCLEVISTWIRYRDMSLIVGVAVWRQQKRVKIRKLFA